jgi:hypothetical protein
VAGREDCGVDTQNDNPYEIMQSCVVRREEEFYEVERTLNSIRVFCSKELFDVGVEIFGSEVQSREPA